MARTFKVWIFRKYYSTDEIIRNLATATFQDQVETWLNANLTQSNQVLSSSMSSEIAHGLVGQTDGIAWTFLLIYT